MITHKYNLLQGIFQPRTERTLQSFIDDMHTIVAVCSQLEFMAAELQKELDEFLKRGQA